VGGLLIALGHRLAGPDPFPRALGVSERSPAWTRPPSGWARARGVADPCPRRVGDRGFAAGRSL